MTITKIITAAIIALSASTSLAAAKCDHRNSNGRFANTNPQVVKAKTVQVARTASTQTGTR